MFDLQRNIALDKTKIVFIEQFLPPSVSDDLLKDLRQAIAWQQGEITLFGKKILEPRLTAWYGDEGKTYTYSGKRQEPLIWSQSLLNIKKEVDAFCVKNDAFLTPSVFKPCNSVLCNFYRNGSDSMGWHQDNELELGRNPVIASVNLGESRRFLFRKKEDNTQKHEILLTHGSLLIMAGDMQQVWQHAVPKEPKRNKERINLTFRHIL